MSIIYFNIGGGKMTQNYKMLTLLNMENGFVDVHYFMLYFSVCLSLKIKSQNSGKKEERFPEEDWRCREESGR